ncbi:MAG TPA: antiterminator LoaP [Treponemataceae bacterium]|jgi:transcription termination/antitermination protein NusG|nr:antiterminator LoaP [Spirochaetaceae bacterium]HOE09111.1 antiterminator LoaP [Treponemataceae bacterium]HOS30994.1 antiterminator LoaP [Treponemataceae bacterium]HQL03927.1 antiterminator LoaP [Treponemataceae bacterium]
MNYFTAQIKTLKEEDYIKRLQDLLLFRAEKQRFIFPKKLMPVRRKGKEIKEMMPLFPGYIFIETEEIDTELYNIMRYTPNFYRFLPDNKEKHCLSGKDLSLIKHFMSFGEIIESSKVFFDENERIIVAEGPLKGLEGFIIKVDRRKKRARIRVEIAQNSITLDLAFDVITKEEKAE